MLEHLADERRRRRALRRLGEQELGAVELGAAFAHFCGGRGRACRFGLLGEVLRSSRLARARSHGTMLQLSCELAPRPYLPT